MCGNIDRHLSRGKRIEVTYAFSDVYRLIADAFEVGIDLDDGENKAEIDRHGLLHCQQVQRHLINLTLQLVDRQLAVHHEIADRRIPCAIGFDSALDRLLGHSGHHEQFLFQIIQALMETYPHECVSPNVDASAEPSSDVIFRALVTRDW